MMKHIMLIVFFCCHLLCLAQPNPDDCKNKVRIYSNKSGNVQPKNGEVFYFRFHNLTQMQDSLNYPLVDEKIEVVLSKDQMHTKSRDIEVYQDERDAFMVIHRERTIVWSETPDKTLREKSIREVSMVRDTIFDLFDAASCKTVRNRKGETLHMLVMEPKKEVKNYIELSRISFWFNPMDGAVETTKVEYVTQHEIQWIINSFEETNYQYKTRLPRAVRNLFFDENNRLLANYRNYQLIDNRDNP